MIGTTVTLNGKEYKVVGTHKKSYLLEREGKQYKATADKIGKIQDQNQRKAAPAGGFLERMVTYNRIFDKTAKMPTTEAEVFAFFARIEGNLSPENLSCDGEASAASIRNTRRELMGAWAELEAILGRKVEPNI